MGLFNKGQYGMFVAFGIWCLADVSSVSLRRSRLLYMCVTLRIKELSKQSSVIICKQPPVELKLCLTSIPCCLGARFDDGAGGDNEVQRTMLELINQLDGFDPRGNIKVLMATNRYCSVVVKRLSPSLSDA